MTPPSGRVPEQGSRWYFFGTEACGGDGEVLGLFLRVSLFIGFFSVGITRRWAKMGPRGTTALLPPPPQARGGGLCAPRKASGSSMKFCGSLLVQKNRQKVSSNSENFYFCTKNNTTVVLLKTASVRVSSNQIIPKPNKIVINMA